METLVAIIYFTVQGTTPGSRFLRSASHRAVQTEIFALSTFTVATIRAKSSETVKHVSSKNELCSTIRHAEELRIGRRTACGA
jgi:hypothetical protein